MTIVADEAEEYRIPLYTQPQAAQIIDVRPETLRNWARGYAYKTLGGVVEAFPMITTTRSGSGRAPSVPRVPRRVAHDLQHMIVEQPVHPLARRRWSTATSRATRGTRRCWETSGCLTPSPSFPDSSILRS